MCPVTGNVKQTIQHAMDGRIGRQNSRSFQPIFREKPSDLSRSLAASVKPDVIGSVSAAGQNHAFGQTEKRCLERALVCVAVSAALPQAWSDQAGETLGVSDEALAVVGLQPETGFVRGERFHRQRRPPAVRVASLNRHRGQSAVQAATKAARRNRAVVSP